MKAHPLPSRPSRAATPTPRRCAARTWPPGPRLALWLLLPTLFGFIPSRAAAEPQAPSTRPPEHDAPLPPGEAKRPMPNYAGEAQPPSTSAADAALWAPRVLLFPLYVVSEYGVRRPLGAAITLAERHHLRERFREFFTFDEEQKIGLFPTGSVDLGLRPHAGVYFFWLDALGQSDFKLRATTGGLDLWTLNALYDVPLDRRAHVRFTFDFAQRPDHVFYGLGRNIRDEATRYAARRFAGGMAYLWHRAPLSFSASADFLSVRFDPRHPSLGDEALADAIARGELTAPPALEDGVTALHTRLAARVDTRAPRIPGIHSLRDLEPSSGSGWSFALHAAQITGLADTRATPDDVPRTPHWLRYGASLLGALDLTGAQRVLQLETLVELTEPLPDDNPVPFTEQVSLGGSNPMRAFTGGRLIDESAAVATLTYTWPIWSYLDGSLHYSVGNVFARHLRDFDVAHLRSSFGLGVESIGSPDHPFEVLFALGTKPFDEGSGVDSVRFVIGTRAGF